MDIVLIVLVISVLANVALLCRVIYLRMLNPAKFDLTPKNGNVAFERNLINAFETGTIMPVIFDTTSKRLRLLLPNQEGKFSEIEGLLEAPKTIEEFGKFVIPEDVDMLTAFFNNILNGNFSSQSVVVRIDKLRKFHRYFEIIIAPKLMNDDGMDYYTGYIREVSKRYQLEQETETTLHKISSIFDKVDFFVQVLSADSDAKVVYVNELAHSKQGLNIGDSLATLTRLTRCEEFEDDVQEAVLKRKSVSRVRPFASSRFFGHAALLYTPVHFSNKMYVLCIQWSGENVLRKLTDNGENPDEALVNHVYSRPDTQGAHATHTDDTAANAPSPQRRIGGKCRILVAEDNVANFKLAEVLLKDIAVCENAPDGRAAIEMLKAGDYDLVLMDVKMPHMDGLIATREIRKFNNDIPIVALTANVFDFDREICIDAGCNEFMTKPLKRADLTNIINVLLK